MKLKVPAVLKKINLNRLRPGNRPPAAGAQKNSGGAFERVPPKRHLAVIDMHLELGDRNEFARLRDISERGFQAQLFSKYTKDQRVNFVLSGPEHEYRCLGEIKWVERFTFFPRASWVAGVRIIGNKVPSHFISEVTR